MLSAFPGGWPGAGLLLLRAAAGAGIIVQGAAYFGNKYDWGLPFLGEASLTVIGALLLIGCLTRFAAVVAAIASFGSMFARLPGPNVGLFESPMTAILGVAIAAAVVFLGAGAFSVDARLFGRREVIIPKNPH